MLIKISIIHYLGDEMTLTDWLYKEERTRAWFARRIGTPVSTIDRIIREERSPTHKIMEKIIQATNGEVLPNDFFQSVIDPRATQ